MRIRCSCCRRGCHHSSAITGRLLNPVIIHRYSVINGFQLQCAMVMGEVCPEGFLPERLLEVRWRSINSKVCTGSSSWWMNGSITGLPPRRLGMNSVRTSVLTCCFRLSVADSLRPQKLGSLSNISKALHLYHGRNPREWQGHADSQPFRWWCHQPRQRIQRWS